MHSTQYKANEWKDCLPDTNATEPKNCIWNEILQKYSQAEENEYYCLLDVPYFSDASEESSEDEDLVKIGPHAMQLAVREEKIDHFDIKAVVQCLVPVIKRNFEMTKDSSFFNTRQQQHKTGRSKPIIDPDLLRNYRSFSLGSNYENTNTVEGSHGRINFKQTNHTRNNQYLHVNNDRSEYRPSAKRPNNSKQFQEFTQRSHTGGHSDSDHSMCSMEEANYIRKNMGRRGKHCQKTICKKTIIKEYRTIRSGREYPFDHRKSFLNQHQRNYKSAKQREPMSMSDDESSSECARFRNRREYSKQRASSDTETSDNWQPPAQRQQFIKTANVIPKLQHSNAAAAIDKDGTSYTLRNLSIVCEPLNLNSNVSLGTIFNIINDKNPIDLQKPANTDLCVMVAQTRHHNTNGPKTAEIANSSSQKLMRPPASIVKRKPIGQIGQPGLALRNLLIVCEPLNLNGNISLGTNLNIGKDKNPDDPKTVAKPVVAVAEFANSSSQKLMKPPAPIVKRKPIGQIGHTEGNKKKRVEEPTIITIDSDSDAGDDRKIPDFETFVKDRNETLCPDDTDEDDIDVVGEYFKLFNNSHKNEAAKDSGCSFSVNSTTLSSTTQMAPSGNGVAAKKPLSPIVQQPNQKKEILVYKGVPTAPPNSKFIVTKALLETKLGKELAYNLCGVRNFSRNIPATTSVFFKPPDTASSEDTDTDASSSDDDFHTKIVNYGKLEFRSQID